MVFLNCIINLQHSPNSQHAWLTQDNLPHASRGFNLNKPKPTAFHTGTNPICASRLCASVYELLLWQILICYYIPAAFLIPPCFIPSHTSTWHLKQPGFYHLQLISTHAVGARRSLWCSRHTHTRPTHTCRPTHACLRIPGLLPH